jgi:hypothetical protein
MTLRDYDNTEREIILLAYEGIFIYTNDPLWIKLNQIAREIGIRINVYT